MSKLSELLKAAAQAKAAKQSPQSITPPSDSQASAPEPITNNTATSENSGTDRYGNAITWNAEQQAFINLVSNGASAILIGAAGTGKTTTMNGSIQNLLRSKFFPAIESDHKHLPQHTPGIVAISYTRRAVMNLRRAMPEELTENCITIHKLLEYQPVFYEVFDETSGEYKKTMKFEPNRNRFNPLPSTIRTIIIDESSMVSVDLFHKIYTALPDPSSVQFIFLGDIQQLPPVFGSAILGFKMLRLPVIELTQVYRQALESPIIRLAHRILSGTAIPATEYPDWEEKGKLKLHPWKKKISADHGLNTCANFFKQAWDTGNYNPETDMILIPFNKAFGTDELNRHIANHIARKNHRITYEVIAGFNKHYFSVGEKILFEKEDAEIISIDRNPVYAGKWPQSPSKHLDYWGCLQAEESEELDHSITGESEEDVDLLLATMASEVEDRVREASHIIKIKVIDSGRELEVKSAAEINNLLMAYALTIHKSQGSEWKKVFLIVHQSHATMIQRELLYTGVTRAREELYVICEPDTFTKGINGQRIKGNTLQEKAEHFQGKLESGEDSMLQEVL